MKSAGDPHFFFVVAVYQEKNKNPTTGTEPVTTGLVNRAHNHSANQAATYQGLLNTADQLPVLIFSSAVGEHSKKLKSYFSLVSRLEVSVI